MDAIKEEHEKKERGYPRPVIKCPDCGEDCIVCWGEKIDPYLRHKEKTDCRPSSESWMHKEAKSRLCKFLNDGNACHFVHHCNDVRSTPPKIKFEEEVSFKNSRFDIGGINSKGLTVFDIEIFCTNKTTNVKDRNEVFWVEVVSLEVLSKLDLAKIPTEITLKDLSKKQCCSLSEIVVKSSQMKFDVEDRKKMAISLGYMKRIESHRAEFIRILAMNGKAVRFTEEWATESKENAPRPYWLLFISQKKCLHCGIDHETSWYKPYCMGCWLLVKNNKVDFEDKVELARHVHINLKKNLSWMNDIKNYFFPEETPCSLCGKLDIEPLSYVTWFGKKKNICFKCFDYHLEQDGIYSLTFD
jgi:hypothetical protein